MSSKYSILGNNSFMKNPRNSHWCRRTIETPLWCRSFHIGALLRNSYIINAQLVLNSTHGHTSAITCHSGLKFSGEKNPVVTKQRVYWLRLSYHGYRCCDINLWWNSLFLWKAAGISSDIHVCMCVGKRNCLKIATSRLGPVPKQYLNWLLGKNFLNESREWWTFVWWNEVPDL